MGATVFGLVRPLYAYSAAWESLEMRRLIARCLGAFDSLMELPTAVLGV